MARSRNIKPGFFKNEVLGEADPIYSLLFAGLWTVADREGRLENRPKRIRAEIFPYRFDVDVSMALDWLNLNSFITMYEIGGIGYIQINNWKRHQTPHHKEVKSLIPGPEQAKKSKEKQYVAQACGKHETTSSQDQAKQNASCPTDSLNLIPDSLNPIKPSKDQNKNLDDLDFSSWPKMPDVQIFSDYKKLRKTKKAPISQTVIKSMGKEFQILERHGIDVDRALQICVMCGWQGFKAEWVLNHLNQSGGRNGQYQQAPKLTAYERAIMDAEIVLRDADERERVERENAKARDSVVGQDGSVVQEAVGGCGRTYDNG